MTPQQEKLVFVRPPPPLLLQFPFAEFGAQLSYAFSVMCRAEGMEKKSFPFELRDLQ